MIFPKNPKKIFWQTDTLKCVVFWAIFYVLGCIIPRGQITNKYPTNSQKQCYAPALSTIRTKDREHKMLQYFISWGQKEIDTQRHVRHDYILSQRLFCKQAKNTQDTIRHKTTPVQTLLVRDGTIKKTVHR